MMAGRAGSGSAGDAAAGVGDGAATGATFAPPRAPSLQAAATARRRGRSLGELLAPMRRNPELKIRTPRAFRRPTTNCEADPRGPGPAEHRALHALAPARLRFPRALPWPETPPDRARARSGWAGTPAPAPAAG